MGFIQFAEQFMFHLIQDIETYKYIGIIRHCIGIQVLYDLAIHHSFISDALAFQVGSETLVDVSQYIPHGYELFFQGRTTLYGEVLEELLDGFYLFLIHESVVVHQGT